MELAVPFSKSHNFRAPPPLFAQLEAVGRVLTWLFVFGVVDDPRVVKTMQMPICYETRLLEESGAGANVE